MSPKGGALASPPQHAAPPVSASGLIEGTVRSAEGAPLTGALIGLLKAGSTLATADNVLSYARTGPDGEFLLRTSPGSYVLRTHCAGYVTTTQPLDVNGNVRLTISLRKQASGTPSGRPGKKR
jgi:hypothetical protein